MKITRTRSFFAAAFLGALAFAAITAQAGEIGHVAPGIANIRDFTAPPAPGFYAVLNSYWYSTDQLNDRHSDRVDSITINPGRGPGVTLNAAVDLDVYAVAPAFIWVSDWRVLGAKYAAHIAPNFATSSAGASLAAATMPTAAGSRRPW